ncbi:MAG: exo-alpha-sialidase, partial [Maioricimonas sp. JB049]
MADRMLVSTRKGLFTYTRGGSNGWKSGEPAFLGENVTLTYRDPRSGRMHVALNLGHFGVKRHISDD